MRSFASPIPCLLWFAGSIQLGADPGPLTIWFTSAPLPGNATTWYEESLPIGNGKLAAVVYGGVGTEQVQFNEDTIWTGQPHDYSRPNAASFLSGMQSNIFNWNQSAFWSTCNANFTPSLAAILPLLRRL